MFFRILILILFSCSLIASEQNENSVEGILYTLQNGSYKERSAATNAFSTLSVEDLKKLKEKLKASKDPELKKIFEAHFQKSQTFYGELGLYRAHLVMKLIIENDEVSGSYFYSRHQKTLTLKGTYDKESSLIKMTETYDGKVTGYFVGHIKENEFKGTWKKTAKSKEVYKYRFIKIKTAKEERSFKKYSKAFDMFLVGDKEAHKVKTWLNINKIDEKQFSFYYKVMGQNGHTGCMYGIASFEKPGIAVFNGKEGAKLIFKFNKDTVKTIPNKECSYYCGARAAFEWELFLER